jgi:putative selenate reductase molybdopterin-binding subunit
VPTIADLPRMQAIAIESESGVGPFNVKGIGENPVSPVAPAIANAIEDAIGVRIRDLPLSAERVYRALRKRGG